MKLSRAALFDSSFKSSKNGTKIIIKVISQNMVKPLFSERYMSIVIKTDWDGHDSKFHEYGATLNSDTCLKNVLYMTID